VGKNLVKKAKELNVKVRGVAFHIGVGCKDYGIYREALEKSAEIFKYGALVGMKMGRSINYSI
jgi:diaminopimelate decarboxylase